VSAAATLHKLLDRSAAHRPDATAVEDPARGTTLTYRELAELSDRARDRLWQMGVRPGDRVGLYMRKSVDAVAAIFGVLKTGAAYVPVDPDAPASRGALILQDAAVRVVVAEQRLAEALQSSLAAFGAAPPMLLLDQSSDAIPLAARLAADAGREPPPAVETVHPEPDALAYILYTSGSTGRPKGVMLTHRSATSFVDWCSATFAPVARDRFSSHAPLHFDLSILDVFVSIRHGATLVLVDEEVGKDPLRLAPLIAERRISVWYSTPSILGLLARYGRLERYDYGALRLVLFAGEVFPVARLRELKALWPAPRYFNLYGPTETNVCTYHEIPATIEPERTAPFPIGRSCEHLRSRVVDEEGRTVSPGDDGELVVAGPGLMAGYRNLPDENARAFLTDDAGERWYRTGDLVVEEADGTYVFHGRRDRMIKRRGYRVELGEIEAGLAAHPAVCEVAVVAVRAEGAEVRVDAYLGVRDGRRPSLIELKQFCVDRLPRYMVPDRFHFVEALPRTSTDKVDYQAITRSLGAVPA
jgi:amino acid adenylation domain-containing protein